MKPDCKAIDELLVDFLYDELEGGEREMVTTHLSGCAECAEQLSAMGGTRSLMSELPELSPSRDDTYVLAIAATEAKRRGEKKGVLGSLTKLGKWLVDRPAFVAVPVAAGLVLLVVGINLEDSIRSLFGASADALAGKETSVEPSVHREEAMNDWTVQREDAPRGPLVLSDEVVSEAEESPAEQEGSIGASDRSRASEVSPEPPRPDAAEIRRAPPARRSPPLPPPSPPVSRGRSATRPAPAGRPAARSSDSLGGVDSELYGSAKSASDLDASPPPAQRQTQARSPASPAPSSVTDGAVPAETVAEDEATSRIEAERDSAPDPHVDGYVSDAETAPALEGEAERATRSIVSSRQPRRAQRSEARAQRATLADSRQLAAEGMCPELLELLEAFYSSDVEMMAEAHYLRGRCLQRLGREEEARQAFGAAARISQDGRWGEAARSAME